MKSKIFNELTKIRVTGLNSNYVKGDTIGECEVVSMADIYKYQTEMTQLQNESKDSKPVIQNHYAGVRLTKENPTLNGESVYYFQYWDGLVFIDIDNKIGWSAEDNKKYIKSLHQKLSTHPWYLWTTTSASGNGIHIICYFPPQFHTKTEYFVSAGIAYSRVTSYLSGIIKLSERQLLSLKIIDLHNLKNYAQCFKFTYGETLVNDNFNPDAVLSIHFTSDKGYSAYAEENHAISDIYIAELSHLNENQNTSTIRASGYNPDVITYDSSKDSLNFKYTDRLQLVYTLMNFYDAYTTYSICNKLYQMTYGTDYKYKERMDEIASIIKSYRGEKVNPKIVRILCESYNLPLDYYADIPQSEDEKNAMSLHLSENQYLSDVMSDIMNNLGDVTILDSPAASGKTTAIANLQENLVMTEPYTAIIKNKIEQNSSLSMFGCLYEKRRISDKEYENTHKFCCTPNNLMNITAQELLDRDIHYVFVDESHTIISDSEFRLDVMSKFLQRLQDYAVAGIKVILLTATALGEIDFFKSSGTALTTKYIKVEKPTSYNKSLTVKRFETSNARKSTLYNDIANALKDGYKCIVPTNAGDTIVAGITANIKKRIADVKSINIFSDDNLQTYYTRKNRFQKNNEDITNTSSIDNVSIVFAGTSFGVGLDINNTEKFKVFFPDMIAAYDIEQFAARLRKTDKNCYLYVDYEKHPHIDYPTRKITKPHSDEDLDYAKNLVSKINRDNIYCEFTTLEDAVLNYCPYIAFDFSTHQYYVDETAWQLSLKNYEVKHLWSQLTSIKSLSHNKYGFSINDDFTTITVDEAITEADNETRRVAYAERHLKIFNAAVDILDNEDFSSEASLYHRAKIETDSIRKVIYNDIMDLLDKKVTSAAVKSILNDCIDYHNEKYDSKVMTKIKEFAKLYSYYSPKMDNTLEDYIQKYREFVVKSQQHCRQETLAGFINKLKSEADNDERIQDEKFISKLSQAILKKEQDPGKAKTYIVSIREFPDLMFQTAQAKSVDVYNTSSVDLLDF